MTKKVIISLGVIIIGYIGYLCFQYRQYHQWLQQFQNGLEHYQQSEYDKAFAIFSNLSCKNNLEECAILKHNSANSMVMMSENFSTETVEQALDVYKKSLILREDPDTRWNYEKVKEFLSKKTKEGDQKSEKSIDNGQPIADHNSVVSGQVTTGNQVSDNQSPDSGQPTTDNGQINSGQTLSPQETTQLQGYQQQLQKAQQELSKDFNTQQDKESLDDVFGGSLFEQFFGRKNPFQEELAPQDPNIKDW